MRRTVPNQEYLRVLFTGRSGSTKTRTAYSAVLDERFGRVLALDAGGQPRSIAEYQPQPDIIGVESVADLTAIYNWLNKGQNRTAPICREMELTPPYQTIIIDGFTEIQRLVVVGITGDPTKGNPNVSSERSDYNRILGQTMGIAQAFYALPMHVIGTVLEGERPDGENGPIGYRHLLVGQSRDQLSSYAEIVGRLLHIERVAYKLKEALKDEIVPETTSVAMFKSSTRHEAKDQTHKLGDVMVDPTMTKILDLIQS